MPLPLSVQHWSGEWGVDLDARANGGLCAPVPETPPRQIILLQRKKSRLGASLGKTSGWVHRATLQRKGVQMLAGAEYRRIDDEGLHVDVGGEPRLLQVDHVIIRAGQDSLSELVPPQADRDGPNST